MEDLVESILDYIRSDYTDYAVMLNGEWGSGKTHFWNNKIKKKIESIQLNGKRHKLKSNYRVTFEKKYAQINLTLYLDGKEILAMEVNNKFKAESIDEIFENQNEKIKIDKEIKPCGQIYLTKDIMKVIQNILGDNRVKLEEK